MTKNKVMKKKAIVKKGVKKPIIPVDTSKDIEDEIYRQIETNPNYIVLYASDNLILLAKKQSLTINISITNSVFQPHERKDLKDLFIVTIVQWGEDREDIPTITTLKNMGCSVKKILCVEAVKGALEWI
jgi:hypothetical protein